MPQLRGIRSFLGEIVWCPAIIRAAHYLIVIPQVRGFLRIVPSAGRSLLLLNRTEVLDKLGGALRPWLGLAIVCGGFSLDSRFRATFWTADYLPNILQQAATNIIIAVGMTFVILTGGIDLSVGSFLALSAIPLGLTLKPALPPSFSSLCA